MDLEKIGKFIAKCRKEKNLTQTQLADKLNMSDKSISKWETGKGMPDASIMLELCTYLDISVNELLSGEHLKEEQYHEKATENIINIAKESDKNKKIKNRIILVLIAVFILLLVILIINILYKNIMISMAYDSRLIECNIENNNIICSFNCSSLVTLYWQQINTNEETLLFINGKMMLENKIRSHYEAWDSMAQLNSGRSSHFKSQIIIEKNKDIIDCKEKIKVYYTNISFNKIKNANQNELQEIIKQSHLIAET